MDIEELEIKEQIKHLIYDLGFNVIGRGCTTNNDNRVTEVDFVVFEAYFANASAMCITYVIEGDWRGSDVPLEIENWYYSYMQPREGM